MMLSFVCGCSEWPCKDKSLRATAACDLHVCDLQRPRLMKRHRYECRVRDLTHTGASTDRKMAGSDPTVLRCRGGHVADNSLHPENWPRYLSERLMKKKSHFVYPMASEHLSAAMYLSNIHTLECSTLYRCQHISEHWLTSKRSIIIQSQITEILCLYHCKIYS
jgi:hypothetical protein